MNNAANEIAHELTKESVLLEHEITSLFEGVEKGTANALSR